MARKEKDTKAARANGDGEKRGRVSQADVPRHDLEDSIKVPRAIEDHYGGGSASPMDVATSLKSTPASSGFRTITGAAVAWGLTDGAYNSQEIKVTALGRRVVSPTAVGDDVAALREALQRPRVMKDFLLKYDRKKVPPPDIAKNVLASMGVDKAAAERTLEVILKSARFAGALRKMKGDEWVDLRGTSDRGEGTETEAHISENPPDDSVGEEEIQRVSASSGSATGSAVAQPKPKPIFIGHGKKRVPLEKLEKILTNFKIPHKVAINEPNLGQPIPTKVKNVMKECGSAILIFTRDEKFFDEQGKEVWRPSENVVYELGAASLEYDDRIVIFMEKGLHFPANYGGIGRIEFEEESIEAKTMELLQELIGFKLVSLQPA